MTYDLSAAWTIVIVAAALWELLWKGIALWHAARNEQAVWFGVLLIVGSVGILPIAYLLTHHHEHGGVTSARSAI